MFWMKKLRDVSVITEQDFKKSILEQGLVPTPIYTKRKEKGHLVKPRGTIYVKR